MNAVPRHRPDTDPDVAPGAPPGVPPGVDVLVEADGWVDALAGADPGALVCMAAARALEGALAEAGEPRPFDPAVAELAVLLADDGAIRALNRDHRGHDRPTNVLSFPLVDAPLRPGARRIPGQPLLLGDVALALETVVAEARASGIPTAHHVSHLVVHGILHLLGHDHETEADAVRMEALEAAILARLGIPDPYQRDPQETHG